MKNLKLLSALFLLSCATQLLSKEQEDLGLWGRTKRSYAAFDAKAQAVNNQLNKVLFTEKLSPEQLKETYEEQLQQAANMAASSCDEEIYNNFDKLSLLRQVVFATIDLPTCLSNIGAINYYQKKLDDLNKAD